MTQKKVINRLIVITILLIATLWAGFSFWMQSLHQKGNLQQPVTLIIEKGEGTNHIANKLKNAGVIDSIFIFKLAARASLADRIFKAGEYTFEPQISVRGVMKKISGGDVVKRKITIPEGLTYKEIRQILLDEEGLRGPPLEFAEGALLPETYDFRWGDKRTDLMRRMANNMNSTVKEAWEGRAFDLPISSPEELLTLASIIEKETSIDGERGIIAGVFVNRLRKNMRLQSDPTVIYGASNYKGDITWKHLKEAHPFNTYVHKGLPPSPIASPGKAAIFAAANPEATEALFFVADGNGGHVFAKTYTEHKINVAAMLERQKNN